MKTAKYKLRNDVIPVTLLVDYDENAPCIMCGEPVEEASCGGTVICPSCDCGKCRYCGTDVLVFGEHIDGGKSLRQFREHVAQCKENAKSKENII